ncbi:hypothetical protein [Kineococcus rhizosphaerae]|uniref:Uncharacterized protein n=1 Tax=Kineococcus rhizosphaerae TaxID=559628 RepID=A0A2T0R1G1_9ACTN|nr:hypothetical protein [Kineococcus rhizosphaerae]PRY13354.1 hypothetical protein CLV37_10822 [Kineococcus rhizosphaerae]
MFKNELPTRRLVARAALRGLLTGAAAGAITVVLLARGLTGLEVFGVVVGAPVGLVAGLLAVWVLVVAGADRRREWGVDVLAACVAGFVPPALVLGTLAGAGDPLSWLLLPAVGVPASLLALWQVRSLVRAPRPA